ncbi:hypothetical protein PflQ2_1610 [Pseudomonas fluorescens Q2-87]|uniref:Uncharacterized protein n=1 Tax=Pseudomonas fluorescens (strain Q2-87) TaxID=1038922 RepID=J2F2G5_PSEFQ|nr:hypothetical protein [Pseudomonas fluorescens]EJL03158.1 hypothetical protein PflQ2_1610 [Pseudomonas fluorescens Q2-87]
MTPETEGKEEKGPTGVPFVNDPGPTDPGPNDPGNEDPGSLMDDAQVPLNDADDAADVGQIEVEDEDESYD